MEKQVIDELVAAGVDFNEAMERFMGNENLLSRMLKKFPEDTSCAALVKATEEKNSEEALKASHTLKGVSGNLSIKGLYALTTKQVELFRSGDTEEAFGMTKEISENYESLVTLIKEKL